MSTVFSITPRKLLTSVLRTQGWLDYKTTPDPDKLTDMLEALNIMLKAWSVRGLKIWCVSELAVPLVAGQVQYSIGPTGGVVADRPLRLEFGLLRNIAGGTDRKIYGISRDEYLLLGNKQASGPPSQMFYDPQVPNGLLSLYNVPDAATVAAYNFFVYPRKLLLDVLDLDTPLLIPAEWIQAVKWGLALETSAENQVAEKTLAVISRQAPLTLENVEDWDREYVSVTFGMDLERIGGQ